MVDSAIITKKGIKKEELDLLLKFYGNDSKEAGRQLLMAILDYASLVENRKDMKELFPPISDTAGLDHFLKIYKALNLATRFDELYSDFEHFLQQDATYLGITLNDMCDKYSKPSIRCGHCAVGKGKGDVLDYEKFITIDARFFKLFKHGAFGRKGEPMLYSSHERNIVDVIEFLISHEISEFSLYSGIFQKNNPRYAEVSDGLRQLKKRKPGINIVSGLTFHLFAPDFQAYEQGYKYAFDQCFSFCDEIRIDLLASEVIPEATSMKLMVELARFEPELFSGYSVGNFKGQKLLEIDGRTVKISYIGPHTNVYRLGNFAKTLKDRKLDDEYDKIIGPINYPPICTSTLHHEMLVIEPDGGIKTCSAFENLAAESKINIYESGYKGLMDYLENRFSNQRKEIIRRLPDLIYGRHSMCDCKPS